MQLAPPPTVVRHAHRDLVVGALLGLRLAPLSLTLALLRLRLKSMGLGLGLSCRDLLLMSLLLGLPRVRRQSFCVLLRLSTLVRLRLRQSNLLEGLARRKLLLPHRLIGVVE